MCISFKVLFLFGPRLCLSAFKSVSVKTHKAGSVGDRQGVCTVLSIFTNDQFLSSVSMQAVTDKVSVCRAFSQGA